MKRKTESDYRTLAQAAGFMWAETCLPKNTHHKTKWRCLSCLGVFDITYHSLRQNSGCSYCSRLPQRKSKVDYQCLGQSLDLMWVGENVPKNNKQKTMWECLVCQHVFMARYNDVQQGHGCPLCKCIINGCKASLPQIQIAEMLSGSIVNYKEGSIYIDVALPDEKIGIEYDCWYWHGNRLLEDKRRVKSLINRGWRMLSIKAREQVPEKTTLQCGLDVLKTISYAEIILSDWGTGNVFG